MGYNQHRFNASPRASAALRRLTTADATPTRLRPNETDPQLEPNDRIGSIVLAHHTRKTSTHAGRPTVLDTDNGKILGGSDEQRAALPFDAAPSLQQADSR